jgi:hypothetical protein
MSDEELVELLGADAVNKSNQAHSLRMSMPEFRGRAWTPAALHYLAEREHYIDEIVYGRATRSFPNRLYLLRSLHQLPSEEVSRG